MKNITALLTLGLLVLVLTGCGGGEEEAAQEEVAPGDEAVTVGGFAVVGPTGEQISVPAVTTERSDAEVYVDTVRPVLEGTARDLSREIDPSAELQNQTLTLSIEVESIEQADEAVEDGLEALRQAEPPDSLQPIHEALVTAYEDVAPAYDRLLEGFNSGDVNELTEAAQSSLPEIEQFNATARAILQELDRAAGTGMDQDSPTQSRGTIEGTSVEEETTSAEETS